MFVIDFFSLPFVTATTQSTPSHAFCENYRWTYFEQIIAKFEFPVFVYSNTVYVHGNSFVFTQMTLHSQLFLEVIIVVFMTNLRKVYCVILYLFQ